MPPSKGRHTAWPDRQGSTAVLALSGGMLMLCAGAALAQTVAPGDRYSGEPYVRPALQPAAETSGPTLSWPGKTPESASQPAVPSPAPVASARMGAPAYASAAPAYRSMSPAPYQAAARQPQAYLAPVQGRATSQAGVYAAPPGTPWYKRYGAEAASSAPMAGTPPTAAPQPSAPPSSPQSIYDPPAGQGGAATPTAPGASAQADGQTAHFYSLHRQYGLTPDPDPIPPQFFTQTADLSGPPAPSPVYKATTGSGATTTAVHPVQSDDATSTLGQPSPPEPSQ